MIHLVVASQQLLNGSAKQPYEEQSFYKRKFISKELWNNSDP